MASFVKPEKVSDLRSGLSKWELDELTKERRKKLTKYELNREIFADGLRCPLCFCLPCAIIAFILLILMGVYIVHPYQVGRTLTKTQCRYNRTEYQPNWKGYCSHRTNHFQPCFKIIVNFNTSTVVNTEAVLLENEQALVHCTKCSFTGGRSDMFGKGTTCSWKSDIDNSMCIMEYTKAFGSVNSTYPCYYDASNIKNVVNMLKVSSGDAALAIFIPLLLLILWLLAFSVLMYDRFKRRILDGHILLKRYNEDYYNGRLKNGAPKTITHKAYSTNIDVGETSIEGENITENITTLTPISKTTPKIKRKKKLPCCKSHFQFNYLDEGIVLEDKPISPISEQPLSFNYLTIDTSPTCNCNHIDGIDVLPQLGDHYQTRSPSHRYDSSPRRPGKILRYLPESFV